MIFRNIRFPHNKVVEGTNVEGNLYFTEILKNILKICGTNVLDTGFKVTPQLILMIIMTHTLIISFFFVLFSDIPINDKLEAFCLISGVYQGTHKMYSAILVPKKYSRLTKVICDLHMKYLDDPVISPILKKICFYCTVLFELFALAFYGVAVAYMALPIFLWYKYDMLTTIFPIQIPFLDWHAPVGYTINIVNHLFICTIGMTGMMSADVGFLYVVLHSIGYIEIMKCRVDKLNRLIQSEPNSLHQIQEQLYECIRAHQDYISYIETVDDIYAQLCMSQLVTSQILLTVSLLLTLWRQWIIGPFIALCGLCQILQYCILGTVVTVQNEKSSEILYGMSWYLLPVRYQKLVVLMIARAQTTTELSVGKFAKLNVETAMQMLKSTYTFVMMLLEFLS